MTYKEKCLDLYVKHLKAHFQQAMDGDEHRKRMEALFQNEAMAHLAERENAQKVSEYVMSLMLSIARKVAAEHLDDVMTLIINDVRDWVDEILTEDEARQVYDFSVSEVGQKLLRNIDLFKESYAKGSIVLAAEIAAEWSRPEVADMIAAFIESLDEDGTL
jgi:hypothetical protein